jgi:hypothetical protein
MKKWFPNYRLPQLIIVLLLIFYVIPSLFFIIWGWRKYKCPQCGGVTRNEPMNITQEQENPPEGLRTCPFCAEHVGNLDKKCRYCGSSLPKA